MQLKGKFYTEENSQMPEFKQTNSLSLVVLFT